MRWYMVHYWWKKHIMYSPLQVAGDGFVHRAQVLGQRGQAGSREFTTGSTIISFYSYTTTTADERDKEEEHSTTKNSPSTTTTPPKKGNPATVCQNSSAPPKGANSTSTSAEKGNTAAAKISLGETCPAFAATSHVTP